MSNGIPLSSLLTYLPNNEADVERISFRKITPALDIVSHDPTWPSTYLIFASLITTALGPPGPLISVFHVGSTSVPDLPAKAIIDIDVVVRDIDAEDDYVPALEAQGFQFILREPLWYSHRFFTTNSPMFANIHVWGPRCVEAERHRIFREWLMGNEEDRRLYAGVKRKASERSKEGGESVMQYTGRKEGVLREILDRALGALGDVKEDECDG